MSRSVFSLPYAGLVPAFLVIDVFPVASAEASEEKGSIEIVRDTWGIPHVFADSDAGAFYGRGYATAEDRALPMTYSLRMIQGRLSDVIGEVRQMKRLLLLGVRPSRVETRKTSLHRELGPWVGPL
jgi:acyl-homoserine lactone acylase PvdQ